MERATQGSDLESEPKQEQTLGVSVLLAPHGEYHAGVGSVAQYEGGRTKYVDATLCEMYATSSRWLVAIRPSMVHCQQGPRIFDGIIQCDVGVCEHARAGDRSVGVFSSVQSQGSPKHSQDACH